MERSSFSIISQTTIIHFRAASLFQVWHLLRRVLDYRSMHQDPTPLSMNLSPMKLCLRIVIIMECMKLNPLELRAIIIIIISVATNMEWVPLSIKTHSVLLKIPNKQWLTVLISTVEAVSKLRVVQRIIISITIIWEPLV